MNVVAHTQITFQIHDNNFYSAYLREKTESRCSIQFMTKRDTSSGVCYDKCPQCLGLGLGLQGLYSATKCADNILGRFTIIPQNQIARVDSFTNLTKRWVFRFRLNASISSYNLISFGKQFHARGPYTANARLPKVSCLSFGTFRIRSSLDLMEYRLLFDGVIISWM